MIFFWVMTYEVSGKHAAFFIFRTEGVATDCLDYVIPQNMA
jgi:hypothetical protein